MNIVLTNDDGIFSPGIQALCQSLSQVAEITVLAPDHNCSSNSHCLTENRPISVTAVPFAKAAAAYAIGGTPTDCIHLGLKKLLKTPVDLVVSGINHGANLSTDTLYSGTLGAAMDAVLLGVPAIAISLDSAAPNADFTLAAEMASEIVKWYRSRCKGFCAALNVNIPAVPKKEIKGITFAEIDRVKIYEGDIYLHEKREGKDWYLLHEGGYAPDSVSEDLRLLREGWITLTPVSCLWTEHSLLRSLREQNDLPQLSFEE